MFIWYLKFRIGGSLGSELSCKVCHTIVCHCLIIWSLRRLLDMSTPGPVPKVKDSRPLLAPPCILESLKYRMGCYSVKKTGKTCLEIIEKTAEYVLSH